MQSTNIFTVARFFRDFARRIRQKATPNDPSYLGIRAMTSKIESWVEHHFPTSIPILKDSELETDECDIVRRDRDLEMERIRGAAVTNKEMGMPHQEGPVPWEFSLFFVGALSFALVVTALATIGVSYYWVWSELGGIPFGRFIKGSEAKLEELLGKMDAKRHA